MCGFGAVFEYLTLQPPDQAALLRMRERMRSRGPDGAGLYCDSGAGVGLAHRRLAIIDLSDHGAQPMRDSSGRYTIVFNGEIYNYRELRRELESRGRIFHSQSDTEVLMNVVAEYGPPGLSRLRGMFAFALWDSAEHTLLLARDPYGIKPLYYADDGKRLLAASQVKALLASELLDTRPEPAGHVGFHLWGSVPEPFTLFRAIRALPAGHFAIATRKGLSEPRPFATVADLLRSASGSVHDGPAAVHDAVLDSVRHHLESDVPVGVFLSSGIDSTALAGLVAETGADLHTLTLAFDEFRDSAADEAPLAETVARHYGAKHSTLRVNREDFEQCFAHLMDSMDQPSIDGVNTYFVSRAAAQAGLKVVLSGLGGDELFGGYPSFRQVPHLVHAVNFLPAHREIGRVVRATVQRMRRGRISPKVASILEYGGSYPGAYLLRRGLFMPWELAHELDVDLVEEGLANLRFAERIEGLLRGIEPARAKVVALESALYMRNQLLRDSDWASMAHGLEIRVPLVDYSLLRALAPHICGRQPPEKRTLALAPLDPLPEAVVSRRKTGFAIPVQTWLRERTRSAGRGDGYRSWARYVSRLN